MEFKVEKKVLTNGLTVLSAPLKTESATVLLLVRVGSRDEDEKVNGISHFLEHMVFKGTKKWPTPMEMNRVVESVGGVFNAFTSHEYTGFWTKLSKKYLKLGIEFIFEAVFEPLLSKKELEIERGVILEEIKMFEDNPMYKVGREFMSQLYQDTKLEQKVIGTPKVIKAVQKKDFKKHLNQWYQPKNMVLVVAGGGLNGVQKLTKELFVSDREGKKSFKDRSDEMRLEQDKPVVKVFKKPIEQAHFCLGLPTFKQTDPDRYGLAVLTTILGGNTSSRLWEEVREKRGLVYYVKTSADNLMDTGYLVTQAGTDVNRLDEAVKVVNQEYQKIGKISKDELSRAKEYLKGRLALSLEDSQNVANMIGSDLLLEGRVRSLAEIKRSIDKVSQMDVKKVFNRVMDFDKLNLTVVGPVEDNISI